MKTESDCKETYSIRTDGVRNEHEIQAALRRLDQRDWQLWATTLLVMLLVSTGLFAMLWPSPSGKPDPLFADQLEIAVRGLFGLVLLFGAFAVYQQVLIKRLRKQLTAQLERLAAAQSRAEMFEHLALVDALTGLYNRRFAAEHLPIEIARSQRSMSPLTVLAIDLDGLKHINDTYGHCAGDVALREFAAQLKEAVRSSDLVLRMGGDEFMAVLPACRAQDVSPVLARLGGLVIGASGNRIPVSFSAGWAEHQAGESLTHLMERADQALYADKRIGKAARRIKHADPRLRNGINETAVEITQGIDH